MLPISVRLGSTITFIRESGETVSAIRCGPADFHELMRKGYLRPAKEPDVFLFDGHPVHPTAEVGTWVATMSDDGEVELLKV